MQNTIVDNNKIKYNINKTIKIITLIIKRKVS